MTTAIIRENVSALTSTEKTTRMYTTYLTLKEKLWVKGTGLFGGHKLTGKAGNIEYYMVFHIDKLAALFVHYRHAVYA
jgi:hypothetical protein